MGAARAHGCRDDESYALVNRVASPGRSLALSLRDQEAIIGFGFLA